jgi:holliday junction DNA helicase RuvA
MVESAGADGRALLRLSAGLTLELHMPPPDALSLTAGEDAELFTHLYLNSQSDILRLYAFATPEARALFGALIAASGIGPAVALNLLGLGAAELAHAIREGDEKTLTKASGVGPKLAKKIILELGDKVAREFAWIAAASRMARALPKGGPRDEALDAVVSLGFPRQRAEQAVAAALAEDEAADTVALIRRALARLSAG